MKVKWESNSRVKRMAAAGVIDPNDIIRRTTTNKFPAGFATVRLHQVAHPNPWVTVHIRGKGETVKGWNGEEYITSTTMRASFGLNYKAAASLSGELSKDLTFEDVHKAVTKVKKAMKAMEA
tara:strand:+ start:1298 stop:1663 length:366 start_codon:yes stop_codon:yes gene_type:complete